MEHFLSTFDMFQKERSHESPELLQIRQRAFTHFSHLGFPTKRWEDWQFTDFSPLKKIEFQMETENEFIPGKHHYSLENVYCITLLNGRFLPEQSIVPPGVLIQSKLDLCLENIQLEDQNNPFWALNTSLMNCGLSIHIPNHFHLDHPIHILFISGDSDTPIMNHPRINIQIGEQSSVTLIEQYAEGENIDVWNNCATLAQIGKGSLLNHYRLQEDQGYHTETVNYLLEKDSSLKMVQFNKSTELYRGDFYLHFGGENASAQINGLSLLKNNQHMDTRVLINHNQPNCQSNQFFKYILDDKATGVFNGRVIVEKNSQKTDSSQSNKNLLISRNSSMHSNPQLEIYADDVRCSHGSSTGQLNEDALYYLRSRGISIDTAKMLMVEGFAGEILQLIHLPTVSTYFHSKLSQWLEELNHD